MCEAFHNTTGVHSINYVGYVTPIQPLEAQSNVMPDASTVYELFDRVVNVREGFTVPLGLRGTVVGVLSAVKEQDRLYEVVFDEEFVGGLTIR